MRKHLTDEGPRLFRVTGLVKIKTHALSPVRKPQHNIDQVIEDMEVADLWYII